MRVVRELTDREGAEALKRELIEYWGSKTARFWIEAFSRPNSRDKSVYAVRSNLVNGYPPR